MAVAGIPDQASVRARAQATARRAHGVEPVGARDPYAGLVTRLIAFALDAAVIDAIAVVVAAVAALVLSILPGGGVDSTVAVVLGGTAFALWAIGYFVVFWTTTGQTPGNRALRIAVRRIDGGRLRPRHAIVRLFGVALSAPLMLGFLPILFTERRRGLHDWLAGTVVTAEDRRVRDADSPEPRS
jgi:uncharacterized RDD family membrane protein YckC